MIFSIVYGSELRFLFCVMVIVSFMLVIFVIGFSMMGILILNNFSMCELGYVFMIVFGKLFG